MAAGVCQAHPRALAGFGHTWDVCFARNRNASDFEKLCILWEPHPCGVLHSCLVVQSLVELLPLRGWHAVQGAFPTVQVAAKRCKEGSQVRRHGGCPD